MTNHQQVDLMMRSLVTTLAECLIDREIKVVAVESCTGGGLSARFTDLAGSSAWFDRGFVTYTNQAKHDMVGVGLETLEAEGAVSEAVVREMAEGGLQRSQANISIAISGIAGPDGGSEEKPVGTVCFACAQAGASAITTTQRFSGNRAQVRQQSLIYASQLLIDNL